jgi:hypothetical protein
MAPRDPGRSYFGDLVVISERSWQEMLLIIFAFLTLDYWQTEEQFKGFRKRNRVEYQRLDKEFEGLTEKETRLGAFYRAAKQNRLQASG